MRRKSFVYGSSLSIGILSGYLGCEKHDLLCSLLLLISVGVTIIHLEIKDEFDPSVGDRLIALAFLLLGFITLAIMYASFNSNILDKDGTVVEYESINRLEGQVDKIQFKSDKAILVVNTHSYRNVGRVRCSLTSEEFMDHSDIIDLLGEKVVVKGKLREPAEAENPGQFDYKLYLKSVGIKYAFTAYEIENNDKQTPDSLEFDAYWNYRKYIIRARERFISGFKPEIGAFLKGVVFGDKSDIDEDVLEDFEINSTGHILAVSGLHVGFLLALLRYISRNKVNKRTTAFIIIIMIIYGEMTMWNVSTLRAVIVLIIKISSLHLRKPFDFLSAISTAGIVILLIRPYMLFNAGFLLSFIAVISIAITSKPMTILAGEKLSGLISVHIGVTPLIAYLYGRFNIMTLLVNIPIVLLSSILVPVCLLALISETLLGIMPVLAITIIQSFTSLIIGFNSICADNLDLSLIVERLNAGILICIYMFIMFILSELFRILIYRNNYSGLITIMKNTILPVLCIVIGFHSNLCNDNLLFPSVGQGDCCCVKTESSCILLDGGGNEEWNIGKNVLKPLLLTVGANRIDVAFLTHMHTDHYKGIIELSNLKMVDSIALSKEYYNSDTNSFKYISAPNKISIGQDTYVQPIWPIESNKHLSVDDENENNMVYLVCLKGIKILITGDLLADDELKMVEYYSGTDILDCDILKVCHHGSQSSSTQQLLDAVSPTYAIISVGKDNLYGHPHKEIIDRLNDSGIIVYRTDVQGCIGFKIKNDKISRIDTMK